MKIKDIMSRNIITCESDDSVLFVSNLMKEYDVGFIPVIQDNKLYGVITDRDLVCDMASSTNQIKRFVSKKVVSINEDKAPIEALNLMKENKIKRLLVNNNDKITGVLSLSDIYNSDISSDKILEALKQIYAINRNDGYFNVDVHEFLL